MNIPKSLIAMTDVIMVMTRTEINSRPARRTITTAEVLGLDPDKKNVMTQDVFDWKTKEDIFEFSGHSSLLEENMKKAGISGEDVTRELQRRRTVLEWMVKEEIRRYTDVANVIREYYANPDRVFQKARVGLR
jgi:flagellar protein FlaI